MRKIIQVLVIVVLFGCGSEQEGPNLSVMSFNIRYGTAGDGDNSWPHRRESVFDIVREERADIIGLQEALRFQLDEIAEAIPGYSELGVGRDDGIEAGEYAAILYKESRLEVLEQGTFWFAGTPETPGATDWGAHIPRICTWARFRDREAPRTFYVFNVHLDHQSQESRERSTALLTERIAAREHPDPIIVTGDFNAGEANLAIAFLVYESNLRLRDSFRVLHADATDVGTFNGFQGTTTGEKIDYVFASNEWNIVSAGILRTERGGRFPSDHFPVTAILSF